MEALTNIIEAVLFASGKAVPLADMAEKLEVTEGEIKKALKELREKYGEKEGIQLLEFNKKAQLATNPAYKDQVAAVLNPIRQKELTRTVLECAAIIAYKQPVTRSEIEMLRGLNSDYAVNVLLDLKLIYPCGRKDAIGHPILFATTDEFLKRFKLNTLEDLPDYDELMEAIRNASLDERDSYLYAREEYEGDESDDGSEGDGGPSATPTEATREPKPQNREEVRGGYEIPEFLRGLDDSDLVKID